MSQEIPKTCKAIVLDHANAPWALREVPVEQPKEGEILARSIACGACHSDVATRKGDIDFIANYPLIPGHEVVGTVVAVGSNVTGWTVGGGFAALIC
ncbi:chaperonin 10-like protein [Aspergillus oleicola]